VEPLSNHHSDLFLFADLFDFCVCRILNAMVKRCGVNLEPELNFQQIVQDTPAFAPGDLKDLVDWAVLKAKRRYV